MWYCKVKPGQKYPQPEANGGHFHQVGVEEVKDVILVYGDASQDHNAQAADGSGEKTHEGYA